MMETMQLTIRCYTYHDGSDVVVPEQTEFDEAMSRLEWHKKQSGNEDSDKEAFYRRAMRQLKNIAEASAILREKALAWTFNVATPDGREIAAWFGGVPTQAQVTAKMLCRFTGLSEAALDEIPLPVCRKLQEEIWNWVRPIVVGSPDYFYQKEFLERCLSA